MRTYIFFTSLVILFVLETGLLTRFIGSIGIFQSPILFFGASLSMAILCLVYSRWGNFGNQNSLNSYTSDRLNANGNEANVKPNSTHLKQDWTAILLASNMLLLLIFYANRQFSSVPLDPNMSDVYPQVLSAARWFLQGEYPYQMVQLPTYQMNNTYLPMQWLPFCVSEYFSKDPRWIPILAWAISLLALLYILRIRFLQDDNSLTNNFITFIGILLPVWACYYFIAYNTLEYGLTLELLPASYYLWLCIGLLSGSVWLIGLALGACLLSRFSILFFLPFIAYYLLRIKGWKKMGLTFTITAIFVLIVFVLPFLTQDPHLLSKIVGNYENGTLVEWKGQSWQAEGAEPFQLARGIGLAIFFKKMFEPDLMSGIIWLKKVAIVLCLLTTLLVCFLFYKSANTPHSNKWILLGGLKLYFVFFYHFVLIPYPYLFLLPMTISLVLLLGAAQEAAILRRMQTI